MVEIFVLWILKVAQWLRELIVAGASGVHFLSRLPDDNGTVLFATAEAFLKRRK